MDKDSPTNPTGWFDKPMRWSQLTLVEDDPERYDPQFWLDFFRRTHSDAACLSAGGCVAYYPTTIPFHHRSAWMGDRDPFGELLNGCRAMGMHVIARTDPHSILDDAAAAHPEWLAVDASGEPRRHWAAPHRWVTCALGPYNFQFMTEVHREIMSMYMVDGIFSNRWAGSGMCYCASCQELFAKATGFELPRTRDPQDAAFRAYWQWRQDRLFELWALWDGVIRSINLEARYIPNAGGGALSSLDMKTIGQRSDILFTDWQARRGLMAPWANGKSAKEYRATLGSKPVGGIFSVGVEERYRWKDSTQSEPEIRLWVADGIANGMRPWYTKFGGVLHDRRWVEPVADIYNWHWRNERYLRNVCNLARVGLVYSQNTAAWYGGEHAREKVDDPINGWYQALIEARVPFDMVHDQLLDAEHIARFKTIILPNIACLSDQQCQQLTDFVAAGGSLVATYESSLYDQDGTPRNTFGLAALFGVDYGGREGPMQNAYINIEHGSSQQALLAGLETADRIVHGAFRLDVRPRQDFGIPPLTLVPPYPDLPMEEVYPRQVRTTIPEVYMHEVGNGRVVYFPWDIDRIFWEVLCVDHGRLLANAARWATNEPPVVCVDGKGVLDVTVWRQARSVAVHLVNLTNPMMMKGPLREFTASGPFEVTVRLPNSVAASGARLLTAGVPVQMDVRAGQVTVRVPVVDCHEVVAIELR